MATTRQQTGEDTRASQGHQQSSSEMQRREQGQRGLQQGRQGSGSNLIAPFGLAPFSLIRRMQEDIDRLLSNTLLGPAQREPSAAGTGDLTPAIETMQRGNEFVIRLDLPGVDADDLEVNITDAAVTVRGQRRIAREDERDGVYVGEVVYGSFERVIPLPTGAVVEDATARLDNGVLEIVVPAPSQEAQRGRRIDIQQSSGDRTEGGQRRS